MLEELENVSILSLGKNIMIVIIILLSTVIINAQSEYNYDICCYQNGDWDTNILLERIDIESRSIVLSRSLPLRGELVSRTPFVISNQNSDKYYVVFTNDGLPAKNAQPLPHEVSYYYVVDTNFNYISNGELQGITTIAPYPIKSDEWMDYILWDNDSNQRMTGKLFMDQSNHIQLIDTRIAEEYDELEHPILNGFRYYKKIKQTNDRLFRCARNNGLFLLDIDIENTRLRKSINIFSDLQHSYLFGVSDDDSVVYVFYMSSNNLGGPPLMRRTEIIPSYVKLIDANDFSLLDSINIEYPPLDYGYMGGAPIGAIDKVDPYFVYFDLNGESYKWFSPAMLFIFDTRTNEASWLRVGWR